MVVAGGIGDSAIERPVSRWKDCDPRRRRPQIPWISPPIGGGIRLALVSVVAQPSGGYQPRAPAQNVLYQIVRDHLETFRAQAARVWEGEHLPRFIDEEFEGFPVRLPEEIANVTQVGGK